ncbi:HAD family hydrolase [Lebetimonas sp. JH369]|uniref:HAD family hydrolase n=1 Tax=Lebetimonas sp. JH369 TaxID=990069 RepID=UPI000463CBBF|nr:HAD family hydrolase [Lebetimonas sp. JH369]
MVIVFDLDDTLYDEIDFVKSGFREISKYLGDEKYFNFMWEEFLKNGSGKIFDKLIKTFNIDTDVKKLIEIYRFHKPNITLPKESKEILEFNNNNDTALISDGYYMMQQNKFLALNLDKYIKYPIFTDFYHTKKPELKPFKMVMEKFPNKQYVYISDNPKKDFIAPKKLGWITVRFKNKKGIYKNIPNCADYGVYSRKEIVEKLKELV